MSYPVDFQPAFLPQLLISDFACHVFLFYGGKDNEFILTMLVICAGHEKSACHNILLAAGGWFGGAEMGEIRQISPLARLAAGNLYSGES